ncbi:tatD [Symbiodinium sp. KB8]|nr:tatD [Symbiodinium sp. KB8]
MARWRLGGSAGKGEDFKAGGTGGAGPYSNSNASGPSGPSHRGPRWEPEPRQDDTGARVWYFGFGANINPWKLRERRGIIPLAEIPGKVAGWRLLFNHKGGMGNVQRLDELPADDGPDAVHGILLQLSTRDFAKLCQIEYEYRTTELNVESYDGRVIAAQAFVSPAEWKLPTSVAPPERYLKLIREGCKEMGIDFSYQRWLQSISSNKGQRGPEYWDAPANKQKRVKKGPSPSVRDDPEGPLKVGSLVDIGANLGKCSPQDLAAQLLRASASQVSHVILTGCSVKGSRDASRLCREWTGSTGWSKALKLVGAAAQREIQETGVQVLPNLFFTAGVHPHDAKSCNPETLDALRSLAAERACVSIGECGLDYDRMFSPRDVQLHWCRQQVELAVELHMPLFLHERDRDASKGKPLGSSDDLQRILAESGVCPKMACIHCFTGKAEDLNTYVSRGYFIGLTGFAAMKKRGAHIRQLLQDGAIPLEQLMIETDCPFMLPDREYLPDTLGVRGRTNEPCCMPAICRAVAECLEVPAEEVAKVTTANARRFFGL